MKVEASGTHNNSNEMMSFVKPEQWEPARVAFIARQASYSNLLSGSVCRTAAGLPAEVKVVLTSLTNLGALLFYLQLREVVI